MSELVLLEIAHAIARITLNRPDKLNAFADDMRERLIQAIDRVAATPDARVLVVTGAGRAFSAGGDIQHMLELRRRAAGFEELEGLLEAGRSIVTRLRDLDVPTVAAVNGPAAGAGLNLALACDLRIASDRATFGETFAKIGLHPDWGGTFFLPRLVGVAKAQELCWTADSIDAAEALRIGLVNRVIAHDEFEAEVRGFAERLASAAPTSVRESRRTLRASLHRTLEQCVDAEVAAQARCWASPDVTEGLSAFTDKRAPVFDGADQAAVDGAASASGVAASFE